MGTDIIEIGRIEKAIQKSSKFMEKVYSEKEREYLSNKKGYASHAGRFAAKEAVSKAMGTGIKGFLMSDIEILNDEMGKPYEPCYVEYVAKMVAEIKGISYDEIIKTTNENTKKAFRIEEGA